MARKHTPSFGRRTWNGDPTTVAEARRRYYKDPNQFVPYVSQLYSFRHRSEFARELRALRSDLFDCADQLRTDTNYQAQADKLDVLSTILEWLSRSDSYSEATSRTVRNKAVEACYHGLDCANEISRSHTWCLLKLTLVRLWIDDRQFEGIQEHLAEVSGFARKIQDPNQRARVYRKLGLLYRMSSHLLPGYGWGIRACVVPGVPPPVCFKSVAALLGIDR